MKSRAGVINHPAGRIMAGLLRQGFMRPDNEAEGPKQPITDLSRCSFSLPARRKPQDILRTQPPVSPNWGHTSDPHHTPSTHFCHPPSKLGPSSTRHTVPAGHGGGVTRSLCSEHLSQGHPIPHPSLSSPQRCSNPVGPAWGSPRPELAVTPPAKETS